MTTAALKTVATVAALAVCAVLGATSARAAIIVNGDFSLGIPSAPGWIIEGNVFHRGPQGPEFWFGAGTTAENGPGIIAFNAGNLPPNGAISQVFGTVPGETYTVQYDFGATENANQQITAAIFGSLGTLLASLLLDRLSDLLFKI